MALLPFLPSKCWDIFTLANPHFRPRPVVENQQLQELVEIEQKPMNGCIKDWLPNLDAGSTIYCPKDKFHVILDVQQFRPEEIHVKILEKEGDNELIIKCKHEERQDQHGFISRQFIRRYVISKNYDVKQITTELSNDGVLLVLAPLTEENESKYRIVPITQTGKPVKQQHIQELVVQVTQDTVQKGQEEVLEKQKSVNDKKSDQDKEKSSEEKEKSVKEKQKTPKKGKLFR